MAAGTPGIGGKADEGDEDNPMTLRLPEPVIRKLAAGEAVTVEADYDSRVLPEKYELEPIEQ